MSLPEPNLQNWLLLLSFYLHCFFIPTELIYSALGDILSEPIFKLVSYFTFAEDTITGRMYSSTKYWNWFLAPSFDSSWRRSPARKIILTVFNFQL